MNDLGGAYDDDDGSSALSWTGGTTNETVRTFATTVAALAKVAVSSSSSSHSSSVSASLTSAEQLHNDSFASDEQRFVALQRAVLLEQLQRTLQPTTTAGASSVESGGGGPSAADGGGRLPRNLTLIFNELQRFSFRSEESLQPYRTHGMTDEEYSRFVSDMWIGIVLTMLMVFIVLALCAWFLYHKFQQWKRQYNDAHNPHTLHHVVSTTAINLDAGADPDEPLPNYTLVSGLPTYDDALEQIRLSHSTNHLLINHQTLMKLFGSAPVIGGKDASSGADGIATNFAAPPMTASTNSLFCANCNVAGGSSAASEDNLNKPSANMYLARIDRCQVEQISMPNSIDSRRSSLATNIAAAASLSASSPNTNSAGTTTSTVITTGSGHRFVCTAVASPPSRLTPMTHAGRRRSIASLAAAVNDRRRASEVPSPAGGRFRRLLSLNPEAMSAQAPPPPMPAALRGRAGALRLLDVPSGSMGSLNVRREQQLPQRMRCNSARDDEWTQNARWSLGVMDGGGGGGGGGGESGAGGGGGGGFLHPNAALGSVSASTLFRHRASLY